MTESTVPAGMVALDELYVPAGDSGSVNVPGGWSEAAGEDSDGWTSWEVERVDVGDGGDMVSVVANGSTVYGAILSGGYVDADKVREVAEEWDADVDDLDALEADERAQWAEAVRALRAIESGEYRGTDAEGPMMNYWYPLGADHRAGAEELAARLDGLPLCVVQMAGDDRVGLALTGGGMDLGWEIAEAHIRCGYFPPAWLTPSRDADGVDERRRYVLAAMIRHARNTAERAEARAVRLSEWLNG